MPEIFRRYPDGRVEALPASEIRQCLFMAPLPPWPLPGVGMAALPVTMMKWLGIAGVPSRRAATPGSGSEASAPSSS